MFAISCNAPYPLLERKDLEELFLVMPQAVIRPLGRVPDADAVRHWQLAHAQKYSEGDSLRALVESRCVERVVEAEDIEGARALFDAIGAQLPVAERACEQLQTFILEHFAIVDLLHESASFTDPCAKAPPAEWMAGS